MKFVIAEKAFLCADGYHAGPSILLNLEHVEYLMDHHSWHKNEYSETHRVAFTNNGVYIINYKEVEDIYEEIFKYKKYLTSEGEFKNKGVECQHKT